MYSAIFLVNSPKFPVTADDGFDGGGCVAAVVGVGVVVGVAVNSKILSSKSLIVKLKFFKFFKTFKSTTPSISLGTGEIRSASLLIQLFIDADL